MKFVSVYASARIIIDFYTLQHGHINFVYNIQD